MGFISSIRNKNWLLYSFALAMFGVIILSISLNIFITNRHVDMYIGNVRGKDIRQKNLTNNLGRTKSHQLSFNNLAKEDLANQMCNRLKININDEHITADINGYGPGTQLYMEENHTDVFQEIKKGSLTIEEYLKNERNKPELRKGVKHKIQMLQLNELIPDEYNDNEHKKNPKIHNLYAYEIEYQQVKAVLELKEKKTEISQENFKIHFEKQELEEPKYFRKVFFNIVFPTPRENHIQEAINTLKYHKNKKVPLKQGEIKGYINKNFKSSHYRTSYKKWKNNEIPIFLQDLKIGNFSEVIIKNNTSCMYIISKHESNKLEAYEIQCVINTEEGFQEARNYAKHLQDSTYKSYLNDRNKDELKKRVRFEEAIINEEMANNIDSKEYANMIAHYVWYNNLYESTFCLEKKNNQGDKYYIVGYVSPLVDRKDKKNKILQEIIQNKVQEELTLKDLKKFCKKSLEKQEDLERSIHSDYGYVPVEEIFLTGEEKILTRLKAPPELNQFLENSNEQLLVYIPDNQKRYVVVLQKIGSEKIVKTRKRTNINEDISKKIENIIKCWLNNKDIVQKTLYKIPPTA